MENKYLFNSFIMLYLTVVCGNVLVSDQKLIGSNQVVVDVSHTMTIDNPKQRFGVDSVIGDAKVLVDLYNVSQSDLDKNNDVHCLVEAVWHESRGESLKGKALVAQSILNRVKSRKFPNTVCGVVRQRVNGVYQYSYLYNKNLEVDKSSGTYKIVLSVVTEALTGKYENLLSSKYYKRCDYESSFFNSKLEYRFRTGKHCFYRERGNV